MSRLSATTAAAAVAVVAASLFALHDAAEPTSSDSGSPQTVPTSQATLACPDSPRKKTTKATLLAVTPERARSSSASAAGSMTVSTLGDHPRSAGTAQTAGTPILHAVSTALQPSVVVDATGAMSAGASAYQWSVEGGRRSGRTVSACAAGAGDWWFDGVDTSVGSTSRLVLSNTTPAIAVVDLEILGPHGDVDTVGQRGIALAPNSQRAVDLARFAPNLAAASVHVDARVGRVTAAVETSLIKGVTPGGAEWLPPATAPSTDAVIDAALDGSRTQQLQIVNPADVEALVQVQVVDDSGPFVPAGLESVQVPPHTVKAVSLSKVSDNGPVSVRLSCDTPVTGAVVSTAKSGSDYAVTAPSAQLTEATVVPVIPGADMALSFTGSQQGSGEVRITGIDRKGDQVFADTVNLKGLRTTEWTPPKKPRGRPAYLLVSVVVDPHAQAVAHYTARDGVAALPLVPGVYSVVRPEVTAAR